MTDRLVVPRAVLAAIEDHVVRHLPMESGGILLGRASGADRVAEEFAPLDSAAPSERQYLADAAKCVREVYRAHRASLVIVATVHSHPAGNTRPSLHDLQSAFGYDCCWHLIAGFSGDAVTFGVYRYRKERQHLSYSPVMLSIPQSEGTLQDSYKSTQL